jgi:hypothetical protein
VEPFAIVTGQLRPACVATAVGIAVGDCVDATLGGAEAVAVAVGKEVGLGALGEQAITSEARAATDRARNTAFSLRHI